MNNKLIAGVSTLALLVTLTAAWAGTGSAPFTISVVVDTTIFIPDLCETGDSTNDDALDFMPGITGLDDPAAIAIDTCATDLIGDWNVSMGGNVPLNLSFKLDNSAPLGIEIALDGGCYSPYTSNNSYFNLTTVDSTPNWAYNLQDAYTLNIWQRVAANTTAVGDNNHTLSIVVTSSYTP